jgi:hypothetical protein
MRWLQARGFDAPAPIVLRCVNNGVAVALWGPATTFLLLSACRFPCVHGLRFGLALLLLSKARRPPNLFFGPAPSGPVPSS